MKYTRLLSDGHFFVSIVASGRKHVWFTVDVTLPSEAARMLSSVRDFLYPPGRLKLDNLRLMTALLDLNIMETLSQSAGAHSFQYSTECMEALYPFQAHRYSYNLR